MGPSVVAPGHRCTNNPEVLLLMLVAALLVFQSVVRNVGDLDRGRICCLDCLGSFPSNIEIFLKVLLNLNGFDTVPI